MFEPLIFIVFLVTYFIVGFAVLCILSLLLKNHDCTVRDMIGLTFSMSFLFWPMLLFILVIENTGAFIKDLHDKITSR